MGFIGYPTPQAIDIPYKPPPPAENPTLTGLPLYYASSLIAKLPFVQAFLWRNAGFDALRKIPELNGMEPRYEPTVIRTSDGHVEPYIEIEEHRRIERTHSRSRIRDLHVAYKEGRTTPTEVIEALLPLVQQIADGASPHAVAFTESNVEVVIKAARQATERYKAGKPLGVLDGVPFAVKDEMDVKGYKRYAGTNIDFTKGAEVDTSWCVKQLEESGAVMVGKLNMHELGMDTTNNNLTWGTTKNPYNDQYYTGGSSGGAGQVVGHGLLPFAIGADGGGSIRIPAAWCGVYGLKPTHGRVSIAPISNEYNATTVQGPLAGNMADLELSYSILARSDPSNRMSSAFANPTPFSGTRNKVLGIYKAWFDRADPEVQEACLTALDYFTKELGYTIIDISIPFLHESQLAHAITIVNECVAKGVPTSSLSPANKILLSVGSQTPARDFILAQKLRNLLMQHLASLFQSHPGLIIVTPTTPIAGHLIGKGELQYGASDTNSQLRTMEYAWLANFTGVPCLQFPVGYVEPKQGEGKVPVGMMGAAEWGSEDLLIEFGYDGERWIDTGYKEGRRRPERWVDVLETVRGASG